jgi:hypothetical protein
LYDQRNAVRLQKLEIRPAPNGKATEGNTSMKATCDMVKKIRLPRAKTQKRQENQSFGLRVCRLPAEPIDTLRVNYAKHLAVHIFQFIL